MGRPKLTEKEINLERERLLSLARKSKTWKEIGEKCNLSKQRVHAYAKDHGFTNEINKILFNNKYGQ